MHKKIFYKKYNQKILIYLFSTIILIFLMNVFINPYNVFNINPIRGLNYYKPDAKRQERLTKFLNLKTLKNVETIFCGVSRTDWTLEPEYYNKLTEQTASNMAMAAASFSEIKEIINTSIKIHPEIKTVLLAIDLHNFMILKTQNVNFNITPNVTTAEVASVTLSGDTTVSSLITIIKNIGNVEKRTFLQNGMKHIFYNKDIKGSFKKTIEHNMDKSFLNTKKISLLELKKLIDELKEKNINVILYMPPLHITYFELIDYNNAWDNVDKFKVELAKVQPFYDFMYVHPINTEEIKPDMKYYFESSHSTYLVGKKVLDKIFKNQGDFGKIITSENVYYHNKINRINLKNWQKENQQTKQWVDDILNKGKEHE